MAMHPHDKYLFPCFTASLYYPPLVPPPQRTDILHHVKQALTDNGLWTDGR